MNKTTMKVIDGLRRREMHADLEWEIEELQDEVDHLYIQLSQTTIFSGIAHLVTIAAMILMALR